MKKRLAALLTALVVLLSGLTALADDFNDDDDFFSDDDFFDDEEMEEFDEEDTQNMKDKMDALAGYSDIEFKQEGDFRYIILEDGASCVTNRYLGAESEVTVPDKLGGLTVIAIGEMTFQDCKVEHVNLPETIISIDNMAFFKCEMLKDIVVPEGVVTLGRCCFGGCISLESAILPESLETVDEFAFLNCISLPEVTFGENLRIIGPNAFCMCAGLKKVVLPEAAMVDETAFTQCPEDRETTYLGG